MMMNIAKAIVSSVICGLAVEKVADNINASKERHKNLASSDEANKVNLALFCDQSVGWWQNMAQDALDALASASNDNAPEKRVVVTTSQARNMKAHAIRFMQEHAEKNHVYTGTGIPELSFGMVVDGKEYTVHYNFSIRKIQGKYVPCMQLYTNFDSMKRCLDTPMHNSYNDCYEYIKETKKEAERILAQGFDVDKFSR